MKYIYNSEFNEINTQEKAYVLGLWYADGFVTYNTETSSYFAGIKLKIDNIDLLEKIKQFFPFFVLQTTENVCVLRCNKREFCEDLIKNGVFPNKSGINKNKLSFPLIKVSFYNHFIRGYFDGDGSIYFSKTNSINAKGMCFTGNNYKFLKKIQEILWYEGVPTKLNYIRGGRSVIRGEEVIFKSLTFHLISQNTKIIKAASKYLYNNSSIHMERKNKIFNRWVIKEKTSPRCPICRSNKTQWQKKNILIICRNCKKYSKVFKLP